MEEEEVEGGRAAVGGVVYCGASLAPRTASRYSCGTLTLTHHDCRWRGPAGGCGGRGGDEETSTPPPEPAGSTPLLLQLLLCGAAQAEGTVARITISSVDFPAKHQEARLHNRCIDSPCSDRVMIPPKKNKK